MPKVMLFATASLSSQAVFFPLKSLVPSPIYSAMTSKLFFEITALFYPLLMKFDHKQLNMSFI